MKNQHWLGFGLTGGLLLVAFAAGSARPMVASSAPASASLDHTRFEVTITNLTRGQVLSRPLVVTHGTDVALFTLGQEASAELAMLAEDAQTAALEALLDSEPSVADVQVGMGPIVPGDSLTITVIARGHARRLSLASMLVNTNDTFAAVNGMPLPHGHEAQTFAVGYDAGSEANSELCSFIPGPACGGMGAGIHDRSPSEGFVHVSSGVRGIGDLAVEEQDWRNPVARVTVRRMGRR